MSSLNNHVWRNHQLTISTKMNVFQACVINTLLYASETWTTYARQEKRLETFNQRCLRRILNIKWQDKITNAEVLQRAHCLSMYTMLTKRRLRWLGHVCRMQDGRIPKDLLYGALAEGARRVGRPFLRYKDACKRDLKASSIDIKSFESEAADRCKWRSMVNLAALKIESKHIERMREKRTHRLAARRQRAIIAVTAPET